MKRMTSAQQARQNHRDNGRYAKVCPCNVCSKSAGENYDSHPDTDDTIDDQLICLCKSCFKLLAHLPGPEAVQKAKELKG